MSSNINLIDVDTDCFNHIKLPNTLTKIRICTNEPDKPVDLTEYKNLECVHLDYVNYFILPQTVTKLNVFECEVSSLDLSAYRNLTDVDIYSLYIWRVILPPSVTCFDNITSYNDNTDETVCC